MAITILTGDILDHLQELPDQSVHCCVTSPPYWGLRDYGTAKWEGGDPKCNHEVDSQNAAMKQRKSTLGPKKDGLNPNNSHFKAISEVYHDICGKCGAIRVDNQIGLEKMPDCGAWNRGKFEQFIDYDEDKVPFIAWRRTDKIVTCGKCYVCKMVEVFREVKRVLRDDGTLWLNLGDSYASGKGTCYNPGGGEDSIETKSGRKEQEVYPLDRGNKSTLAESGLKPKDLIGVPWRVAFALQADGWYLRSDIIWSKPNPMPESVTDRPTKAHEYVFLLTKKAKYYYDADAVREESKDTAGIGWTDEDGTKHYRKPWEGSIKSSGRDKKRDLASWAAKYGSSTNANGRNRRTVWEIATQPTPEAHFATFPEALVEPCIKAGTSERGCCAVCGAGWERVVEKGLTSHDGKTDTQYKKNTTGNRLALLRQAARERGEEYTSEKKTLGWQPTCTCGELLSTNPCVVLDPFAGSGTTGLVARNLKRDAILIELNKEYVKIMKKKLRLNEQLVM
jgi:DNA modification methylase